MAEQSMSTNVVQSVKKDATPNVAKTVVESHFSKAEINNIKLWYSKKNYTEDCIKAIQRAIGFTSDDDVDGQVGKNTINKVYEWQKANGLTPDGKFGNGSAAKVEGLTLQTNGAKKKASSAKASINVEIPVGNHKNSDPLFQKQTKYPNSPYVSKEHYGEMKAKMGNTPYESWNITDERISSIYSKAVRKNKGYKSTISSSGCGVTSYANLKGQSPKVAAEESMKGDHRVYDGGTAKAFFLAQGGDSTGEWQDGASKGLKGILDGKYLICSMGKGNWCQGDGHFILVYGYENGNVHVSDSNSSKPERQKGKVEDFIASYKYGYLFS